MSQPAITAVVRRRAAQLLLAGPMQQWVLAGWTPARLAAERPGVVDQALAASPRLYAAAHLDARLDPGPEPDVLAVTGPQGKPSPQQGAEAGGGNLAGPFRPGSEEPGAEGLGARGQRQDHDQRDPVDAPEGGEPAPDQATPAAALGAPGELGRLRRANARLAERVGVLESQVPSRAERRRANRTKGRLRQAERRVGELTETATALERERDELLRRLKAMREERDDARREADRIRGEAATERARLTTPQAAAAHLVALLDGAQEDDVAAQASVRDALTAWLSTPPEPEPAEPPAIVARPLSWAVTPLGGGEEIGGSALLIEAGRTRILVDAGVRPQASTTAEIAPPGIERALAAPLDAIVVTHAHADHCGYVPVVVASQPQVPVLTSGPTAALLPVMWDDAQGVMRRRAEIQEAWCESGADTLYGPDHVKRATSRIHEVAWRHRVRVGDLDVELFPAGHVLGAAGVVVEGGGTRVVVTGDVCDVPQRSVIDLELPPSAKDADLLVIESTYCDDIAPPREEQTGALLRAVSEVVEGGGRVLIPAFALGRAQEISLLLRDGLPHVPVLVDGLAQRISDVYAEHSPADVAAAAQRRRAALAAQAKAEGTALDLVPTVAAKPPADVFGDNVSPVRYNRRRLLRTFRNGVVITTSGMLTGGPAVAWAEPILANPGDALFLAGYQDEESPGRRLLDLADNGGTFDLPTENGSVSVPVRARVERYHLSAHADRHGLTGIVDAVAPEAVMAVHGVRSRQYRWRQSLNVRGHKPVPTATWAPSRA